MKNEFGSWFSGLCDGEACFSLPTPKGRSIPQPRFDLTLRDDDTPMLEDIKNSLGFGQVYTRKTAYTNPQGYESKRLASFVVWNKSDCLALVSLLEEFPLRSKKKRDFVLWAECVRLWNTRTVPGRWAKSDPAQLEVCNRMQELSKIIKETRLYQSPTTL